MSSSEQRNRKRGVRASRARLYHALSEAGFKTQAALAEHMADLEQLETVPKDIVNRVFRELPVELQTLERVARALNTEAYHLYQTSDETENPDTSGGTAAPETTAPPWHSRHRILATGLVLLVCATVLALWWLQRPSDNPPVTAPDEPPLMLVQGQPTVLVLPLTGDDSGELANAVRQELGRDFNVASDTAAVLTATLPPAEAARKLRTDVTLDGKLVFVGRYTAVRIHLFAGGLRQQVWAESYPSMEHVQRRQELARHVAVAMKRAIGMPVPANAAGQHYPLAPVQDDYLQGRALLDQPASELNIRRAQASFNAALRQDANYAQAHAGLCETLLLEHWMSDESRALNDAAQTCGQALQLQPDDPEVGVAYAHFLRLTGQLPQSLQRYEQLLSVNPQHAEALYGLAETHLLAYRQNGDEPSLQLAMTAARAAADADPAYWKPLYLLAPMYYYAGNVKQAIAVSEEALERDVNEYVVANLGTFQFCAGQFDQARDSYLQARDIAPQSYVGNEFLGKVYYFLGEFETSAELRRKAIESVAGGTPEIHEMWGNLGDSLYQAQHTEEAAEAYLQAAEIVERDFLRGTATASGRASRAYYYLMIEKLLPGRVPASIQRSIRSELETVSASVTESNALLRVAQAWMQESEPDRARLALDQAAERCAGYAAMPDLAGLRTGTGQAAGG